MPLSIEHDAATRGLRLAGALDIYGAESLCVALLTQFAGDGEIDVDLGGVETCDTSGVQLLLSARRTALEKGCALTLNHVPEAVRLSCQRLGLSETI